MHFGKAVLAFDCNYNRSTTEDKALFFRNSDELMRLVDTMEAGEAARVGRNMAEIAARRYTWAIVAQQYFELLGA
jgi:glycosyltransferase involved in cell wall biosynthesis